MERGCDMLSMLFRSLFITVHENANFGFSCVAILICEPGLAGILVAYNSD